MARHRKIDVRMWGDEKFLRLSRSQPCGQSLFQYLLTGPHCTSVPGLFKASRVTLADELEWSLEGFDKAFEELSREGLAKADWKARVVWIPGAKKYNTPENPNVVKGWRIPLDEVPECALKAEAISVLRTLCQGLGKGFPESFEQICPKGLANPEPDPEQDPYPDPERDARGPANEPPKPNTPEGDTLLSAQLAARKAFERAFKLGVVEHTGNPPGQSRGYQESLTSLARWSREAAEVRRCEVTAVISEVLAGFFADERAKSQGFPISFLATTPTQYLPAATGAKCASPSAPRGAMAPVSKVHDKGRVDVRAVLDAMEKQS